MGLAKHVLAFDSLWTGLVIVVFLRSDAAAYYLFHCWFCATTIRGRCLFLWKAWRHQLRLDKVGTSETVTVARRCQKYAQPLSPAVSRGNDSYNTNSPSASVVTVIKIIRICGCVPRLLAAATIRGRRLFSPRASD